MNYIPPYAPSVPDWMRQVSTAANPLFAKSAEIVSLKADYGATGDGAANDTEAFRLVASGQELFIPPGNFLIDPVTFSGLPSLKIRGSGRDVTTITLRSTGTALTFSNVQWLQMSDLTIQASGLPQTLANATGIQLDTGSCNAVIERVKVTGFSLDGIRMVGTSLSTLSGNTISDSYILGCGRNQVYGYYANDGTMNNVQVGQLETITHADFGILFENCGENDFHGVKVWQNKRGYKLLNCTGQRHYGCRIELSDYENVWDEGGYDNTFDDACRFYSGSQAGNGLYDYFYAKNAQRLKLHSGVHTWDATYGKWAVNIDTGCDDITLKSMQITGFDGTNAGPIRIASGVTRISTDIKKDINAAAVAAGSTVYLTPAGGVTTAAAGGVQCTTQITPIALVLASGSAPGVGKNYTVTLQKNGVDTAMTGQISGSSFIVRLKTTTPSIRYDEDDWLSVKLVTDAGSAVTDFRGSVLFAEF